MTFLTNNQLLANRYFSTASFSANNVLYAWGNNSIGQLGLGTTTNYSSPVQVGALNYWSQVSCGYSYFSLGIQSPGSLWSWGSNSYGQLGVNTGPTSNTSSPVRIGALSYWTQIAAGNAHWLAVQSPGTLWSCGYNGYGQLGNNTSSASQGASTPVQIGALSTWTQIAAGNYSSYAIQSNGTLWSWGYNAQGQLGQNNTANLSSPTQVGALSNWTQISVNSTSATALALQSNGTLWAWGYNAFGQIGNSNTTNLSSPVQIGALTLWIKIASGGYSSYAIQSNGTLWSWGLNSQGQLGLNTTVGVSSPVQIGTASTWIQVGAGSLQLAAIQNNGTLWMCGYNSQGQIGNNSTTNISVLTQVGSLNKWNFATGARQILAQQIP
jgi:alpha-tubulin suppressor-like RCC1 family protein